MPQYFPGHASLAPRIPRLKQTLLAVLVATGPALVLAQTPSPGEKLEISRTASALPYQANDPLLLWFKEQDRVLDDILLRLARIETLVRDIHRLVAQLPSAQQSVPAAAVPAPQPPVAASPPPPAVPQPAPLPDDSGFAPASWWGYAAVAALLGLLLLKARRRRTPAKSSLDLDLAVESAADSVPPASTSGISPRTSAPTKPTQTPAPVQARPTTGSQRPIVDPAQGEQALELAEIMLSMGLGHGAAQTLVEQIGQEPKQALRHWLKLLEIYRQNGQRDEFEQSAEELRLHFNVRPEDWHAAPTTHASLEDYPHIAARLTESWRKVGCLTYVQELLSDNRGGARSGFPQSVAEELLLLAALLKAGNPS